MAQKAARNTEITYYTTDQLCERYKISRTTLWRWSKAPGFPDPLRFGRSVRWPVEPTDRFLTQQEA